MALLGLAHSLQNGLLYFPERMSPEAALAQARALGLAPWPAAADIRGWLREPAAAPRGTVVLFHGNAGQALHRSWYADRLQDLGFRTLLAEYPAYGPRGGELGEAALVADAAATLARAGAQFGAPLYVAGESLGAGVAAAAIRRATAEPAGVVLFTPWSDLRSVARHHYPFLPLGLLLRDRYDTVANLARFPGPVAVVVAGDDRIIPPAVSRDLYGRLPGPKRLFDLPGAGHNDWPVRTDARWWRELMAFVAAGG